MKIYCLDNICKFGVLLFIILISKTVFWGIINFNITFIILLFWFIIYLCRNKIVITKRNLIAFCVTEIFIIILVLAHINDLGFFYLRLLCYILISFLTASILSRKEFVIYYVKIIYIISILSIIMWMLVQILPWRIISSLSTVRQMDGVVYVYNPIYTFATYTVSFAQFIFNNKSRNAGMFWEPGAFEIFINLAIIFLLFGDGIENKKGKFIILALTLLTTKSTTGYIIFILIVCLFRKEVGYCLMGKKKNRVVWIEIGFILLGSLSFIIGSNNIQNKISSENISFAIRFENIENSITMIKEKPIGGYGPGRMIGIREDELNIERNSCGLLYEMYLMGVPYVIFYLWKLTKSLYSLLYCNKIKVCGIISIILIMMMTEGICNLLFFTLFFYEYNDSVKRFRKS